MNLKKEDIYELELFIAKLLRTGVLISGVLLLIGWLTQIQFTENPFLAFQVYNPVPLKIYIPHLWETRDWGMLIALTGLLVLISLPILRVLMTAILFLRQGERKLAIVAASVLVLLAISFSLGFEI